VLSGRSVHLRPPKSVPIRPETPSRRPSAMRQAPTRLRPHPTGQGEGLPPRPCRSPPSKPSDRPPARPRHGGHVSGRGRAALGPPDSDGSQVGPARRIAAQAILTVAFCGVGGMSATPTSDGAKLHPSSRVFHRGPLVFSRLHQLGWQARMKWLCGGVQVTRLLHRQRDACGQFTYMSLRR
jgi:hypothetical protein